MRWPYDQTGEPGNGLSAGIEPSMRDPQDLAAEVPRSCASGAVAGVARADRRGCRRARRTMPAAVVGATPAGMPSSSHASARRGWCRSNGIDDDAVVALVGGQVGAARVEASSVRRRARAARPRPGRPRRAPGRSRRGPPSGRDLDDVAACVRWATRAAAVGRGTRGPRAPRAGRGEHGRGRRRPVDGAEDRGGARRDDGSVADGLLDGLVELGRRRRRRCRARRRCPSRTRSEQAVSAKAAAASGAASSARGGAWTGSIRRRYVGRAGSGQPASGAESPASRHPGQERTAGRGAAATSGRGSPRRRAAPSAGTHGQPAAVRRPLGPGRPSTSPARTASPIPTSGVDRLVRRAPAVVVQHHDDPAARDRRRPGDRARAGREHRVAGAGREVDPAVAGEPGLGRRVERVGDQQGAVERGLPAGGRGRDGRSGGVRGRRRVRGRARAGRAGAARGRSGEQARALVSAVRAVASERGEGERRAQQVMGATLGPSVPLGRGPARRPWTTAPGRRPGDGRRAAGRSRERDFGLRGPARRLRLRLAPVGRHRTPASPASRAGGAPSVRTRPERRVGGSQAPGRPVRRTTEWRCRVAGPARAPRRRIKERLGHGRRHDEAAARERRALRAPDPPLEPEDEAVHLQRAQRHLHHRPAAVADLHRPRLRVRQGDRRPRRHRHVRRHQAPGAGAGRPAGDPRGHALRQPALARRHAHQLPRPCTSGSSASRSSSSSTTTTSPAPVCTKKELLVLRREKDKLEKTLGGIRDMAKVPSAVWIVDTNKEHIAVAEAKKLDIPVVAILDTNCDPDVVDFPIPGNDDAIRAVALLTRVIADAVAEGLMARAGRGRAADRRRGRRRRRRAARRRGRPSCSPAPTPVEAARRAPPRRSPVAEAAASPRPLPRPSPRPPRPRLPPRRAEAAAETVAEAPPRPAAGLSRRAPPTGRGLARVRPGRAGRSRETRRTTTRQRERATQPWPTSPLLT